MTTTTKQRERIRQHGLNLLEIFKAAPQVDPLDLCKKLRRLEFQGHALAERVCNGEIYADDHDRAKDLILAKVDKLLNFRQSGIPVFLNTDPRGYALKIDDSYMREHKLRLATDWGGYGLIAPDIT